MAPCCLQACQPVPDLLGPHDRRKQLPTSSALSSTHTLWHARTCTLPCPNPHIFKNVKKLILGVHLPTEECSALPLFL